jgi:spermidine synthase
MTENRAWISEKWENVETRYRIKEVLFDEKSEFQHMQIVDSISYGRMLLLDGIVQTTEKDEFFYHEMMVHPAALTHPEPKNALIIGGGDGGILREVLKYSSIEKCTIVEIDRKVIELCQKYLPGICRDAFDDPRTDLVIADGAQFIKETDASYDLVIIDSPDPIGPATILFSEAFYTNIHKLIAEFGIMVRQTGSVHLQVEEQKEACRLLRSIFKNTNLYAYIVPTYVGGLFSSVFCSDQIQPFDITEEILDQKKLKYGIETLYYNPTIHRGAFQIPQFLKERGY